MIRSPVVRSAIVCSLVFAAGAARAGIPFLNASCPENVEVHADEGGPVFIGGNQAKLKKFNENYYEATGGGVTVSISVNPDGSPSVSYTGKGGTNGVCRVAKSDGSGGSSADVGHSEAGLDLHCRGSGSVTKTHTTVITAAKPDEHGLRPQVTTKKEHDLQGSIDVQIRPGAAKVRVPKEMVPAINSLHDGWAEVDDFAMTDDTISGKIHVGPAVKPSMKIDRRSGEIAIDGSNRTFSGDCEAVDRNAKPKF